MSVPYIPGIEREHVSPMDLPRSSSDVQPGRRATIDSASPLRKRRVTFEGDKLAERLGCKEAAALEESGENALNKVDNGESRLMATSYSSAQESHHARNACRYKNTPNIQMDGN